MASEAGINIVCFLLITGEAKSLQVADIILPTTGKRDDMVDSKISFWGCFSTALALVFVALENILPNFWRNANTRGFTHVFLQIWQYKVRS